MSLQKMAEEATVTAKMNYGVADISFRGRNGRRPRAKQSRGRWIADRLLDQAAQGEDKSRDPEPAAEPFSLIRQLLNNPNIVPDVADMVDTEEGRGCRSEVRLCNLDLYSRQQCRNNYMPKRVVYMDTVPQSFDDWKKMCAVSVAAPNMHGFFLRYTNCLHTRPNTSWTQEECDLVMPHLSLLREFRRNLVNTIMRHGIIAGGFILSFLTSNFKKTYVPRRPDVDIDLYMSPDSFRHFSRELKELLDIYPRHITRHVKKLKYLYSGFGENSQQILYHVQIEFFVGAKFRYEGLVDTLSLDIVVAERPRVAISNFDLSFCKINAYCADPTQIPPNSQDMMIDDPPLFSADILRINATDTVLRSVYSRHGTLSEPFAREYYNGNRTTRMRIHKYLDRNFRIDIPILPDIHSGTHISLYDHNYRKLRTNRDAVPRAIRRIRRVMHKIFNIVDLQWFAENYREDETFVPELRAELQHMVEDGTEEHLMHVIDEIRDVLIPLLSA